MNLSEICCPTNSLQWLSDFSRMSSTGSTVMETPQHLPAFKLTTNPFFVEERIHQINVLLERNFYVISDLEKRISNLVELNEKIARELDTTNKLVAKPNNCMLEQRPPEEKII